MITLLYAHPYPQHSRAGRALFEAVADLPGVQPRLLYERYPDFHIDVRAEQAQLLASATLVLQHPLLWYHAPALLSLWFEKVLRHGWAYGHDAEGRPARALAGKRLLWVTTTGGEAEAYGPAGYNHFTIEQTSAPLQQLAAFCGMRWLPPLVLHNALRLDDAALREAARGYRARLEQELADAAHAMPAAAADAVGA
ncbi:NAD(P)H-dependent oxidoreductase [Piscinibacter sakaiensis]|uniref:Glutathione-regulated potassium-efflux system ancillary protein KefF n=1 Tax=Piscinibacter sakaiensis TaxID=1547922 RepID=A0A0K8P3V0_PISS1|nr:NAD(P)H-dependent oxidoreductase [Piscinibacter sakaiensis]GAP37256.1 glutathione-regulated potassium-efflux system ancillary protein KefF [Piscinibacter sakaiensis]